MDIGRIFISGLGAVSPAGWELANLRDAVKKDMVLPPQVLERPGWSHGLKYRGVPAPVSRPAFMTHPRLRRSSPITQYAVGAAIQAVARLGSRRENRLRLGVIVCLQAGCVQYTQRFFAEALKEPSTASPLLFPETVFAAPASHVAAVLEDVTAVYTLLGDPGCFVGALALGAGWLQERFVDACLVIGAEETNWLLAEALWLFEHSTTITAGAGAICLTANPELAMGVELAMVTDPHNYGMGMSRQKAAKAMRLQLPTASTGELLCDGLTRESARGSEEAHAWSDWNGSRLSPKSILGEGLVAGAAWQCVLACDEIASKSYSAANVSVVGSNQQAIGARFVAA